MGCLSRLTELSTDTPNPENKVYRRHGIGPATNLPVDCYEYCGPISTMDGRGRARRSERALGVVLELLGPVLQNMPVVVPCRGGCHPRVDGGSGRVPRRKAELAQARHSTCTAQAHTDQCQTRIVCAVCATHV